MSGKEKLEEIDVQSVKEVGEESPTPSVAEQVRKQKLLQKENENRYNAYKKNLQKNVELKRLQVEELELNARFYHAKRAWMDLSEKVDEMDAEEARLLAEEQQKAAARQRAENHEATEKPKIITPAGGKPRGK